MNCLLRLVVHRNAYCIINLIFIYFELFNCDFKFKEISLYARLDSEIAILESADLCFVWFLSQNIRKSFGELILDISSSL